VIGKKWYQHLAKKLEYYPDTGIFVWRDSRKEAGTFDTNGYVKIGTTIGGRKRQIKAHRLAWFMIHGEVPIEIDYKDRVTSNNRIKNLRACTHLENMRNQGLRSDNTSGVTGVVWYRRTRKWHVQISLKGKTKHIGFFGGFEDAVIARREAEAKFYGEFASS